MSKETEDLRDILENLDGFKAELLEFEEAVEQDGARKLSPKNLARLREGLTMIWQCLEDIERSPMVVEARRAEDEAVLRAIEAREARRQEETEACKPRVDEIFAEMKANPALGEAVFERVKGQLTPEDIEF